MCACTHTLFQEAKKSYEKFSFSFLFQIPLWQQRQGGGHSAVHLSGRSKSEARHYLLTGLSHNHKTTVLASLIPILHPWREQRCPACAEVMAETKEKVSECQKLLELMISKQVLPGWFTPCSLIELFSLQWELSLIYLTIVSCEILKPYPHPFHWLVVVLFPWLGYSFKICS